MADPEVQRLLDQHRSLIFDELTQKVKCSLTNHEMPAKVTAIESYVKGKKYKRLADLDELSYDDHKSHIVSSSKKENEMFCRLTLHHLEKTAKAIQRHINGKKYKNALVRWDECKRTGKKFIAHIRRKAKRPEQSEDDATSNGSLVEDESGDDDSNNDAEDVVNDDMSDLYPEADFQDEESDEDEIESVEIEKGPFKTVDASKKQKNKKKKDGKNINSGQQKRDMSNSRDKTKTKNNNKSEKAKKNSGKKRSRELNGKGAVAKKKIKIQT